MRLRTRIVLGRLDISADEGTVDRQSITFVGLARDHYGIALWQADGTGPEPEAVGHTFQTPIGPITAHYYSASRDYDSIDPQSTGGLVAGEPITGFRHFPSALKEHGYTLGDVVMKMALTTSTGDTEGTDWSYAGDVEKRRMRLSAPFMLELKREAFIALAAGCVTLTEDYRDARSFSDVLISLVTDPLTPQDASRDSSSGAQKLAHAFLKDVANATLRLSVDKIQLTADGFGGRGRTKARFADIIGARLATL